MPIPERSGESFGSLLYRYRIEASLTQEALAEKAAMSATAIAALEQGRRRVPRLSTVQRLGRALDLDPVGLARLAQAARAGGSLTEPVGTGSAADGGAPPRFALPRVVARMCGSTFVGRREELGRLEAAWRERQRFVMVLGEAGIGKSRLVSEAAMAVHASDATVLWGRCSEARLGLYEPFVEALRQLLAAAPPHAVSALPARCGELARLVPDVLRSDRWSGPTHADAGTEQRLLFEAVATVLDQWTPTLLVLEDLHWADPSTLDLVGYLVGAADLGEVTIVGTARPLELTPQTGGRLADLGRQPQTSRLHLGGLAGTPFRQLVAGTLNGSPPEELVEAVARATDGNPLFAQELTAHLVEVGAVDRLLRGDGWDIAAAGVPERVRDTVGGRLAILAPATIALLGAGAVFGREFTVALAADAAGLDQNVLVPLADEALASGLIVESTPGDMAFSHSLVQNAVAGQLSRLRRTELHRRAAQILEERVGSDPGAASTISYHWDEVAEVDPSAANVAAAWAVRAGDAALAAAAADEAIARYDDACRWWASSTAGHCDALIRSGNALRHCGRMADADERFGQALLIATALDDPELRARAAVGFGLHYRFGPADPERVAALDGARDRLEATDRRRRPLLTGLLASHLILDGSDTAVRRRRSLAAEVTSVVEDPLTPDDVLVDLAGCRLFLSISEPDRLERVMRRIAGPAEALRDFTALFEVWYAVAWASLERGDMAGLATAVDRMADVDNQAHSLHSRAHVALTRATMAIIAGRYDDAERLGAEAHDDFVRSADPNATLLHLGQVLVRAFDDGRAGDLLPFLLQASAEVDLPPLTAATALAAALADDTGLARHILDEVGATGFTPAAEGTERGSTLAFLADAAAIVGASEHAPRLYELLAAHPVPVIRVGALSAWWGPNDHHLGVLARLAGRWSQADDHFQRALALERRMAAAPFSARTRLELARLQALANPGSGRAQAAAVANEVLSETDHPGWGGIAREARNLLKA